MILPIALITLEWLGLFWENEVELENVDSVYNTILQKLLS